MSYIADFSFRSKTGKDYNSGEEITDYQFENLPREEKRMFSRKKEIDYGSFHAREEESVPSPLPGFLGPVFGPGPETSSSFGGFEGGSGGGAGVTESYDPTPAPVSDPSPSYDSSPSCDSFPSDSGGGCDSGGGVCD